MNSSPPPAQTPAPSTLVFQPLNSIWNHKWLIMIIVLVVGTAGTYVAWIKGTPEYRATAVVYVAPRFASILEDDKELEFQSNTQYQQFVSQQLRTINRYDIVHEALQRLGEQRFELWQRPDESDRKAAERLQGALNIRDVRNTYLITVSLDSDNPRDLHTLVNTVVSVYLERSRGEEIYASDERIRILEASRAQRAERIGELTRQRSALAQELGVTTFADGTLNPYDNLLIESTRALLEAERQRFAAEAERASFDAALGGEPARQALHASAADLAARDPGLNSLKANIFKRRGELLEQISGLSDTHPVRLVAQRELDDLDAEIRTATARLIAEKSAMLLDQRIARVRETRSVENVLRERLREQREQAADFATRYNQALSVSETLERERRALNTIDDRIEFLDLETSAPGFIRISTWAREPIDPVSGGRKKLAMIFLVGAGMLGLIAAIAIDLIDGRVLTARQAQALLGFPALAALLEPSDDPALQRLLAEQLRTLALALERERDARNTRHLMITTARLGCGGTSLCFNLAEELRHLGLRVLVLEANLLSPDPRYAAPEPRPGLLELLAGSALPAEAVQPRGNGLPERIAFGATSGTHLHHHGRLPALLQRLRTNYDMVLIDAAPVRLSADTEYLAGICDATWLVIRARHALIGEVKGSASRLERAAPPVLGMVVTGLPVFRGGGYYTRILNEYRKIARNAPDIPRPGTASGTSTPGSTRESQVRAFSRFFPTWARAARRKPQGGNPV